MILDIGGNIISQSGSILSVNTGQTINMNPTGGIIKPSQTLFIAIGNGAGTWTYFTDAAYNKILLTNTPNKNVGSCYDNVNSRFTAPFTGMYWFMGSTYLLKDNVSDGYYYHPMFYVNGSGATRTVNGSTNNYRIRGYGEPFNSYGDGQINQIYSLTAGDYVEYWHYSNGASGNRYYTPYSRFAGVFLG